MTETAPARATHHHRLYGPAPSAQGWTLFVANLQPQVTGDILDEVFGDYGRIVLIRLHLDRRTLRNKGYALVVFEDREAAQDVINRCHGSHNPVLRERGKSLAVSWALVKRSSASESLPT